MAGTPMREGEAKAPPTLFGRFQGRHRLVWHLIVMVALEEKGGDICDRQAERDVKSRTPAA